MHVSYFVCVFANSIKNSYKKKKNSKTWKLFFSIRKCKLYSRTAQINLELISIMLVKTLCYFFWTSNEFKVLASIYSKICKHFFFIS